MAIQRTDHQTCPSCNGNNIKCNHNKLYLARVIGHSKRITLSQQSGYSGCGTWEEIKKQQEITIQCVDCLSFGKITHITLEQLSHSSLYNKYYLSNKWTPNPPQEFEKYMQDIKKDNYGYEYIDYRPENNYTSLRKYEQNELCIQEHARDQRIPPSPKCSLKNMKWKINTPFKWWKTNYKPLWA